MKQTNITICVLGSHSALDVCRGAKDEGFKTLVVAQKGREKTYDFYYKTKGSIGCVDQCLILDEYADILKPNVQKNLINQNCIFVPHRSFETYLHFDYQAIEKQFKVPVFGNKFLLKIEERGTKPNQYDLLDKAEIKYPRQFFRPEEIDRLSLVKVLEKERGFERAFFLVESYEDYKNQVEKKLKNGVFTQKQLACAVIEEFVLGVQVNFNFFYSVINKRLELLGTDTRRQTNIEGINKLPVNYQTEILQKTTIKYEEAGHMTVTVLESLLEKAFVLGEKFVQASQKLYSPGIFGPFALQTIITAGPPQKDIIVIDVSPRMPGSPGISSTPYSGYLFGQNISMGKRVAMEIKEAIRENKIEKILT